MEVYRGYPATASDVKSDMRIKGIQHAVLLVLTMTVFAAVPSWAQNRPENDDAGIYGIGHLLTAPADLRISKRREAKRSHSWILTDMATVATGFDSNIHESPNGAEHSAAGTFGAKLEALRYAGDQNRFRITTEALGTRDTKTSDTSPFQQEVTAFWGRRTGSYSTTATLKAKHHNDSSTNVNGDDLIRNFEYFSYQGSFGAWIYPGKDSAVRISARVQRRDYQETPGRNSLDWWKVEPRIAYRLDLSDKLQSQIFYSLTLQRYDANLASTATGITAIGNPEEKHLFHRAGLDLEAELSDRLRATLEYDFKAKDDRFEGFESYQTHTIDVELQWRPTSRWKLVAGAAYGHRDYDKRPGTNGDTLHYDRWQALALASYRFSDPVTLFVDYELSLRDTNRSTTRTTFRDYERHATMVGCTVAY